MGDVKLKSGKTVDIDVSELTVGEWRKFVTSRGTADDENAVVMKCTGLAAEEIEAMLYQDFRQLVLEIFKKSKEPLSPN